jgi:hypothetical protein
LLFAMPAEQTAETSALGFRTRRGAFFETKPKSIKDETEMARDHENFKRAVLHQLAASYGTTHEQDWLRSPARMESGITAFVTPSTSFLTTADCTSLAFSYRDILLAMSG